MLYWNVVSLAQPSVRCPERRLNRHIASVVAIVAIVHLPLHEVVGMDDFAGRTDDNARETGPFGGRCSGCSGSTTATAVAADRASSDHGSCHSGACYAVTY